MIRNAYRIEDKLKVSLLGSPIHGQFLEPLSSVSKTSRLCVSLIKVENVGKAQISSDVCQLRPRGGYSHWEPTSVYWE